MKRKPKPKFPRVPIPKPTQPHKVKKGGKPRIKLASELSDYYPSDY